MSEDLRPPEFYVGYLPKAPASLARTVIRVVAALGILGSLVAVLLVFGQSPFAASAFEYGQFREYDGVIEEWPYPALATVLPNGCHATPMRGPKLLRSTSYSDFGDDSNFPAASSKFATRFFASRNGVW